MMVDIITLHVTFSWNVTLVRYIYVSGALALQRNFARCKIHFASKSCVLLRQRYCTALEQWTSAKLCGVAQGMELWNFRRWRHLYSALRFSAEVAVSFWTHVNISYRFVPYRIVISSVQFLIMLPFKQHAVYDTTRVR